MALHRRAILGILIIGLCSRGMTYAYAPDNKRVLKTKSAGTTVHHLTLWVGSMRVGTYTNRTPDASDSRNDAVVREDLYIAGRRARLRTGWVRCDWRSEVDAVWGGYCCSSGGE